ncbi:hypothetical protein BT67DRAFT_159345 [Trichocladium antarcticum]|uniref:Uncharacterized protein n=1 Tax=Trichocladium antarcticum TaxID=1450529 RepID=A0AAN6UEP7_9PEZI|nr:hypothetical protein BT67DRAFT_159345 [Trichocladium antarcticum]
MASNAPNKERQPSGWPMRAGPADNPPRARHGIYAEHRHHPSSHGWGGGERRSTLITGMSSEEARPHLRFLRGFSDRCPIQSLQSSLANEKKGSAGVSAEGSVDRITVSSHAAQALVAQQRVAHG